VDQFRNIITKREAKNTLERISKRFSGAKQLALEQVYDQSYHAAIKRIESQPSAMHGLARKALSWITYAERPLTTGELCHALAVDVGDDDLDEDNVPEVEDVISVCAGLVVVDEASNVVRLVHYTTQEYFERTRGEWIPNAQLEIASACLTCLSFHPFRSDPPLTDEEFESRIEHYGFLNYAARYWDKHALTVQEELFDLALPFLQSGNLISWSMMVKEAIKSSSGGYFRGVATKITGLHATAGSGLLYLSEMLLLLSGGNANAMANSSDSYSRTPLFWAANNGHEATVKLIMEREDVDANARSQIGETPLMVAAYRGHKDVVELLIKREDVDVNANDGRGWTALMCAAREGHRDVVELLIKRDDVNVNADHGGWTALMYAALNGHRDVVELLIKREDVDVNSESNSGSTALMYAAEHGHRDVVELLIKRGDVNVNADHGGGWTALMCAARVGHRDVVELLIKRDDVNVNADHGGRTALMCAAENGHRDVVELLIKREDVDVNADVDGWTALMYAAEYGHRDVVELLIKQHDVNVDATREYGWTALELAQRYGHKAVVELLQSVTM
jgi:ankyrin repeat protein